MRIARLALGERPVLISASLFRVYRRLFFGRQLLSCSDPTEQDRSSSRGIAVCCCSSFSCKSGHGLRSASTILGIDPGAHGAIAVLDQGGDLLEVHDMPSTTEATGRTSTNAPLLAAILARTNARVAFCEFVAARPTDAKAAAFSFGRARGVIEGCAGALGLPIVFLTPPTLAEILPGAENEDLARTFGSHMHGHGRAVIQRRIDYPAQDYRPAKMGSKE